MVILLHSETRNVFSLNNHSKLAALQAAFKFSRDVSSDKQNPFEAGTKGNSGILSPKFLNDSGPVKSITNIKRWTFNQTLAPKKGLHSSYYCTPYFNNEIFDFLENIRTT